MGSNDKYHPDLSPLSWLFGVWETVDADMTYPTVEPSKYDEVVEFLPNDNPFPFVEYKSVTWHPEKKTKLHCESGFLRIDSKAEKAALLFAHHFGITEVSEGPIEKEKLCVETKLISEMSFMETVKVLKIVRKWTLEDGLLHYTVLMQTANQPLQLHLKSCYKKKN